MLSDKRIGVVVPAHNEELLIVKTLTTMPAFVDALIVVNDGSRDKTLEKIKECAAKDPRITIINKQKNEGLGKAITDGYAAALELDLDITAVMAGDAQMDPDDLEAILQPILKGEADYTKGNRFFFRDTIKIMPMYRYFGNALLTILTKFSTGYFGLIDPQCGYTAISRDAIHALDLKKPHRGYGYNAHLLYQLNLRNLLVKDVNVRPVYGREVSGIRLHRYIPSVSWLLTRLFFKRIFLKYFLFDFHPVGACYFLGMFLALGMVYTGYLLAWDKIFYGGPLPVSALATVMLFVLCSFGFMMLWLFAIFLDIEYLRTRRFTR